MIFVWWRKISQLEENSLEIKRQKIYRAGNSSFSISPREIFITKFQEIETSKEPCISYEFKLTLDKYAKFEPVKVKSKF